MDKLNQNSELKQITLGRQPDNNIYLEKGNISRQHARIIVCGPTVYLLEDLDSKNGTFVNGERIKRKLISEEDRVILATSEYTLKELLIQANLIIQSNRTGKDLLDYTQEFAVMQELYEQFQLFRAEEFTIQNAIKSANEKLRLGGALAAPTLALLSVALGGPAIIATISACGLGMLIPAIGSKFLNENEKLQQPKLHFNNSWKCPKCGDKTGWLNKSWQQMAQQKKCSKCDAIWAK